MFSPSLSEQAAHSDSHQQNFLEAGDDVGDVPPAAGLLLRFVLVGCVHRIEQTDFRNRKRHRTDEGTLSRVS